MAKQTKPGQTNPPFVRIPRFEWMSDHPVLDHQASGLFRLRSARTLRASSWDRSGANSDFIRIEPGQTATLMSHEGPGCITHLYCAMALQDLRDHRNAILRCYWDGSSEPSVEVPMGDFFALAHGRIREFASSMVVVNGGFGASHGLNAYFPMPFATGAVMTVENRGPTVLGFPLGALWYHVEFEVYDEPLPEDILRFHACFRQERPTSAVGEQTNVTLHTASNLDGLHNYVALDTEGQGRMVGLVLEVDNLQGPLWYGEGDDMVFIDGQDWPPQVHGTGTEEIFGGGACPSEEYAGPYSGFHLVGSDTYEGLVGMYRWYLHDPIHFSRSIRWSIEHGHANNFSNDYSSVAFWYQEPQARLPVLPGAEEMLPPLPDGYDDARANLLAAIAASMSRGAMDPASFVRTARAGAPLLKGDVAGTLQALDQLKQDAPPGAPSKQDAPPGAPSKGMAG